MGILSTTLGARGTLGQDLQPDAGVPAVDDDQSRAALFYQYIEKPAEDALHASVSSFALPRSFLFPMDTEKDDNGAPRTNQLFGVDISHHNGPGIRFDLFRQQSIYFVYMKAGQGRGADPMFIKNWGAVGTLGGTKRLYRGAYFFISSQVKGEEQGRTFGKIIGKLDSSDLPPVVDLEWDPAPNTRDQWTDWVGQKIVSEVLACAQAVQDATKRKPIIYTAGSWLSERIGSPELISKLGAFPIWLADYSASALGLEVPKELVGLSHKLWQFTDRAQVSSGYSRALDASIYRGTEQQFQADFGVTSL